MDALIVEDEDAIRTFLAEVLLDEGWDVRAVACAEDAWPIVRTLPPDLVHDADGAHDATLPSPLGSAEAEKTNDVGAVGVEVLLRAGLVESCARCGGVSPRVSHVRENLAAQILRHGVPEMQSDDPVGRDRVLAGHALDG